MTERSRHLSVHVDRPVAEVYAFASDPANLPLWAPGLGGPLVHEDGAWSVLTPHGRARLEMTPLNEHGVLDHVVTTPSGERVHVPLRVVADGAGSEVVFTLRRAPGTSEEEFEQDAERVNADLALLKQVVEAGAAGGAGGPARA
ncbi:SRPBCC family protein [Kineococcus gypseus]